LRVPVDGASRLLFEAGRAAVQHQYRIERGCVDRARHAAPHRHEPGGRIVSQHDVVGERHVDQDGRVGQDAGDAVALEVVNATAAGKPRRAQRYVVRRRENGGRKII